MIHLSYSQSLVVKNQKGRVKDKFKTGDLITIYAEADDIFFETGNLEYTCREIYCSGYIDRIYNDSVSLKLSDDFILFSENGSINGSFTKGINFDRKFSIDKIIQIRGEPGKFYDYIVYVSAAAFLITPAFSFDYYAKQFVPQKYLLFTGISLFSIGLTTIIADRTNRNYYLKKSNYNIYYKKNMKFFKLEVR